MIDNKADKAQRGVPQQAAPPFFVCFQVILRALKYSKLRRDGLLINSLDSSRI